MGGRRAHAHRWRSPDRHVPGPAMAIVAIASIQIGAALARTVFDRTGPAGMVLLRVGFGAVVLLGMSRPGIHRMPRRALATACLFGVVVAAMNLTLYEALARIPLGIAVTIEFIGPLSVAIVGSRRLRDLLWVACAAGGVLLFASYGGPVNGAGIAFALVSGVLWGTYILLNQRVGRILPGGSGLSLAMAVAGLVLVPFGIAGAGMALLEPRVLLIGFAVGMLSSAIGYSLEVAALRRLSTAAFGILMSLEPAAGAVAGWAILGQHLPPTHLAAIGLVSVASAGATMHRPAAHPAAAP